MVPHRRQGALVPTSPSDGSGTGKSPFLPCVARERAAVTRLERGEPIHEPGEAGAHPTGRVLRGGPVGPCPPAAPPAPRRGRAHSPAPVLHPAGRTAGTRQGRRAQPPAASVRVTPGA